MNPKGTSTSRPRIIALIGNPNSGKTSLFNALTGLRQKVANYPGVTVERKEGDVSFDDGSRAVLLDLPGTYSLAAHSPDEELVTAILLGRDFYSQVPDLVVCVVDASNLERNLYLVSQVMDRHLPVVVALNMVDVAEGSGIEIDASILSQELGVPVVHTIGNRGTGIRELKAAMRATTEATGKARQWPLPDPVLKECEELAGLLQERHHLNDHAAYHEAISLLTSETSLAQHMDRYAPEILAHVRMDHQKLDFLGFDRQSVFVISRYDWIKQVCRPAVKLTAAKSPSLDDALDRIVTHKVWGFIIFFAIMALIFQSIFSWASIPMEWIAQSFDWIGHQLTETLPPGDLRDLVVDGALAGVAAVVTFLPQIMFLFLFIGILEDTGYMARAAFMMDKIMSKVGLQGKSFIPLLSSFACAIPGIMASRAIANPKDRLATMLVTPLISCSARLPVYTLLIAAFVPHKSILGIFSLPGLTLFGLYFSGLIIALGLALLFKKTFLKGPPSVFILELPRYRIPSPRSILLLIWERAWIFLRQAGTIILGISIVLWFLASYPKMDQTSSSVQLQHSYAGRAGRLLEPLIKPLGFDWKIGIGLVSSIMQRELFVSTMATIYNIEKTGDTAGSLSLQAHLQRDIDPATGRPSFTLLTALCIMVYYMLAMQCLSTLAIMKRETNSWRWPLFQLGYMTALAYGATFLVYRMGLVLGIGA
jgi:ferrous iron transport protein B